MQEPERKEEKEEEKEERRPPEVTLSISWTPGPMGGVSVAGPIHDRMLCYGMLGAAWEAILTEGVQKPQRMIEVPSAQLLPGPGIRQRRRH